MLLEGPHIVLIILFYCIPDRFSNHLRALLWIWETGPYQLCHPGVLASWLHVGFDHLELLVKNQSKREISFFSTLSASTLLL